MRCHPFVLDELKCAQMEDTLQATRRFDRLLWSHMGYLTGQGVRAFVLSIAKARWLKAQALPATQLGLSTAGAEIWGTAS